MSEATWVGIALRAVISLGVLFLGAGLAARVCKGALAWGIASGFYALLFVYLSLGVVPEPNEAGLLYAIQWGACGAALYCSARTLGWLGPTRTSPLDPDSEA